MVIRLYAIILCFSFCIQSCAQTPPSTVFTPVTDTFHYTLGSTAITLTLRTYNAPTSLFFVHLHDNEGTAEDAAVAYLERYGGQLLSIHNQEQRNIEFRLNGRRYKFDPNRIFSDTGIIVTLEDLSTNDTSAKQAIADFAQFIITTIPDSVLVVAMHNNTDDRYSVRSYQSLPLNEETATLHINPDADPDNFILTTDSLLFQHFKTKNINAVLQRNWPLPDDGSLSIFFSKQNRLYINIEAEHKHATQQGFLVKELHEYLEQKKKVLPEGK